MQQQILTPKDTLHPNLKLVLGKKKKCPLRIGLNAVRHCTTGCREDILKKKKNSEQKKNRRHFNFLFKDCMEIKKIKVKYKQRSTSSEKDVNVCCESH